jgi:hypothetical protein
MGSEHTPRGIHIAYSELEGDLHMHKQDYGWGHRSDANGMLPRDSQAEDFLSSAGRAEGLIAAHFIMC